MTQSTSWNQAQWQQYKILFGRIYPQVLDFLGIQNTNANRQEIHEEFKEYLGYESISNEGEEYVRVYIWEVVATCAIELGLYIILPDEPPNADELPLEELWIKDELK